uniref:Uncharacterized protein n=1 Tax=Physcomitrium patens TaxID=3218 RepID=A0A2K1JE71_PHYPA|nr:hypothetical protein PHYPA_020099 [Physcomitrium patens]
MLCLRFAPAALSHFLSRSHQAFRPPHPPSLVALFLLSHAVSSFTLPRSYKLLALVSDSLIHTLACEVFFFFFGGGEGIIGRDRTVSGIAGNVYGGVVEEDFV